MSRRKERLHPPHDRRPRQEEKQADDASWLRSLCFLFLELLTMWIANKVALLVILALMALGFVGFFDLQSLFAR